MDARRTGWITLGLLALLGCSAGNSAPTGTTGGESAITGCGTTGGGSTGSSVPLIITISGFTFSPLNLDVPAGATVTVRNIDTAPHTVTSENRLGAFTPGGVNGVTFDSGLIQPGAEGSFTIPAWAPVGTAVPYYCGVHFGMMRDTTQITVR